ncbi:hypothetical protein C8R44DRAFT_648690, partial [Mycena epipterygia]
FVVGDFFAFSVPDGGEQFDLIYAYLFFAGILPSQFPAWGTQTNALFNPGGYLIALKFPFDPETEVGPPWFVPPEHYNVALGVGKNNSANSHSPVQGWAKILDRAPACSGPAHVGSGLLCRGSCRFRI